MFNDQINTLRAQLKEFDDRLDRVTRAVLLNELPPILVTDELRRAPLDVVAKRVSKFFADAWLWR